MKNNEPNKQQRNKTHLSLFERIVKKMAIEAYEEKKREEKENDLLSEESDIWL